MEWSLTGLWAMALYALPLHQARGISPQRLSVAGTLRAFRRMLRDYLHPIERGSRLRDRIRTAVIDDYPRKNKTSRGYPRKKQERPPGVADNRQRLRNTTPLGAFTSSKGLTA